MMGGTRDELGRVSTNDDPALWLSLVIDLLTV